MGTGIAVANQLHGAGVEVLLGAADGFLKCSRYGLVEHAHAAARPFGDFETEQAGMLVLAAGRERPDLPGFERFVADPPLALQFRCRDEFLHTLRTERVAEVGVAELGGADALLLFLDAAANLPREAHGPF